ncbi:acyltransferase [Burkholderia sp. Bp9131]|nr:acyltransferase [Burkholderia sp. Bp9131]
MSLREAATQQIPVSQTTAAEKTRSLAYRPDIDGLRAVAVLSVVLFHAFPSILPGGFVGVDVFFVISGYLITNILLAELDDDRFSVLRFYGRRVRRIFPAFVLVMIATYALGWFSLFKGEFKQLGEHIAAGAAFVANFAFWNEAGYFDTASNTKPLLHLWSLGIEEQFYILWPLLLAWGWRNRRLFAVIAFGFVASFVANMVLIASHPDAAFFLPISRFWELLAGAGLAYASTNGTRGRLAMIGLLLCVGAMVGLNESMQFPGWWALLPVVGAMLLIAGGPDAWINRNVLSQPAMVWVGKISFPLYLWHWPLLSFATILAGQIPAAHVRVLLVGASFVLSWLTYALIERPVRFGARPRLKVTVLCVLLLAIGYMGAMTYARDGLGFRKGYNALADANTATLGAGKQFVKTVCGVSEPGLFTFCDSDKRETPDSIVWGDSKADALYWGLVRESKADHRWMLTARISCAPLAGVVRTSSYSKDDPDECARSNQIALQAILNNRNVKTVVLATAARVLMGQTYSRNGAPDVDGAIDGLTGSIRALQTAGKRVALLIDNPTLPDPRECMDRAIVKFQLVRQFLSIEHAGSAAAKCTLPYGTYLSRAADYRAVIARIQAANPTLIVIDSAAVLCDRNKGVCPIARDGKFLYSYGDHISDSANTLLAKQVLTQLDF